MHPRRQAAHHVGPCGVWVVDGSSSVAHRARVAIFDVTPMHVAVVPILIPLVGRGTHKPTATALLALVRGWLLWVAAAIAIEAATASASAVFSCCCCDDAVAVVGRSRCCWVAAVVVQWPCRTAEAPPIVLGWRLGCRTGSSRSLASLRTRRRSLPWTRRTME